MTELKWFAIVLIAAWCLWFVRLYRILHREDDRVEADEEARRRQALGYATDLDTWRQIERQPHIRRTGQR